MNYNFLFPEILIRNKITFLKFLLVLNVLCFSLNLTAQKNKDIQTAAPPDNGKPIDTGETLIVTWYSGSLNFGTFYINGTGVGSLILDPISGLPTESGSIILINSVRSIPTFQVYAKKGKNINISSPPTTLTGTGGNTDQLNLSLQFDRPTFQTTDKTVPEFIKMGGTISVNGSVSPDSYSGTVTVTINFE